MVYRVYDVYGNRLRPQVFEGESLHSFTQAATITCAMLLGQSGNLGFPNEGYRFGVPIIKIMKYIAVYTKVPLAAHLLNLLAHKPSCGKNNMEHTRSLCLHDAVRDARAHCLCLASAC